MSVGLLLIGLFGLITLSYTPVNVRESVVKAIIFFSCMVLGVTEILSLFHALNFQSLVIYWSSIDAIIIYLVIKRNSLKAFWSIKNRIKTVLHDLVSWEKLLLGFSLLIIVGILIQGIVYPTNNWDSMTYHMPRIIHWIQNESLTYYRTPVYPQLNSPPFSEILILNINLLAGNDYFSNAVQGFYLISTALVISMVAKQLGLNRFGQILTVFIFVCLPEVILLGSSTHTELVLSFFMVAVLFYLINLIQQKTILNFLLLGASLGLAVATKSTAYIYLAIFLFIGLGYQLYQILAAINRQKLLYYLLIPIVFVWINIGHAYRNYKQTDTLFATTDSIHNYYVNEEHSFPFLMSNVSRNLSNQFGVPKVAPVAQHITESFNRWMGVDVNEPKITSHTYTVDPLATHENNGANFYHTVLMLLSMIWILFSIQKQTKGILIYWVAVILSFILFCFYLKWQPWAKLHVPFFIFYSVVLAHFIMKTFKYKLLFTALIVGFVSFACLALLFNYSRPFITYPPFTSEIKITDSRYKKYFSRFLEYYPDFKTVSEEIKAKGFKKIGLLFGNYDMEYPLFVDSYYNDVQPIHLNACEISNTIPVKDEVDCIVSTIFNKSVVYRNEIYYNTGQQKDGYLFLFLKK